ncbi:serine/threonine protein kinase [Thalassolituus sp.]|jgi:WD40 repeat protein|uniref:YncE family protein n=2 Tax=Thalassolituus TaxID=187492 RepID=UPI00262CBCAD|nr:serine/threonine protein kinase [uncultured Thalassolituus sp.]TNC92644.1 MAG: serine/threonine protein kinase [Thalassolituus sp.]
MKVRNTLLATAVAAGLGMAALPAQAGWLDWLFPSQPEETPEDVVTEPGEYPDGLRPAIFVGNNWDGTIDVIDGDNYEILGRVNGIPDYEERMDEIKGDFWRYTVFLGIRQLIGEGNDQYVDDMYSTNDGELLIVSRPSFADVVALDLETGGIVWRFEVDGVRSDHMALSPDGSQVAVSASTGNVVHLLNVYTGEEEGRFPAGNSPHENLYSDDGKYIYHSSIGFVFMPFDGRLLRDTTRGERKFLVYDTELGDIVKDFDIKTKLEEAGLGDLSPSIRPMAHTSDYRYFYFQLSFLHGFVEFDMEEERITRLAELPNHVPFMPKMRYVNDSAHHGLAMSADDTKLCVAGTMDDYAAIVDRETFEYTLLEDIGEKAYWAVSDRSGENCLISWSGTDQVSVINYATGQEVKRIDVGNHPQRVREGMLKADWISLY